MKLLSLALSAALWAVVTSDEAVVVRSVEAPLDFRDVPRGADIQSREGRTVEVFLRGPSSLIHEISAEDISVGINASGLEYGPNAVVLSDGDVRRPFGVEIVRI